MGNKTNGSGKQLQIPCRTYMIEEYINKAVLHRAGQERSSWMVSLVSGDQTTVNNTVRDSTQET